MLIIGHRGAPSLIEENTIDSFKQALTYNIDGIELDVQLSQDNQLVVLHDLHTHKLNGQYDSIRNYNLHELKQMNSKIPILEDILKMITRNIELHIEIKSEQINNSIIINKISQLIEKYQLKEQVILSSFNPFVLSSIKRRFKTIRIGLLWTKCPNEPWLVRIMSTKLLTYYSYYKIKPYSFHANIEYMTPEVARWAKNHNIKLYYYTVNNVNSLNKAKKLYADGIFSDYPNILD